jgi:hypothetical protein
VSAFPVRHRSGRCSVDGRRRCSLGPRVPTAGPFGRCEVPAGRNGAVSGRDGHRERGTNTCSVGQRWPQGSGVRASGAGVGVCRAVRPAEPASRAPARRRSVGNGPDVIRSGRRCASRRRCGAVRQPDGRSGGRPSGAAGAPRQAPSGDVRTVRVRASVQRDTVQHPPCGDPRRRLRAVFRPDRERSCLRRDALHLLAPP